MAKNPNEKRVPMKSVAVKYICEFCHEGEQIALDADIVNGWRTPEKIKKEKRGTMLVPFFFLCRLEIVHRVDEIFQSRQDAIGHIVDPFALRKEILQSREHGVSLFRVRIHRWLQAC